MVHACNSEKRDRGREWAGGGLAEERERKGPEGEIGTKKRVHKVKRGERGYYG
jgi:hypothetical protein